MECLMDHIIRHETASDIAAISEVTIAAFHDHPFSRHTEQFIIHALRDADALALSLVAKMDGRVVGHIAFSPVAVSDGSLNWHGLGPVSVLPEHQRRGLGKALVYEGLSLLKTMGSRGCVLVGDPGYYERFGFKNLPELIYDGVPPEVFLALPLGGKTPRGTVVFHDGFAAEPVSGRCY